MDQSKVPLALDPVEHCGSVEDAINAPLAAFSYHFATARHTLANDQPWRDPVMQRLQPWATLSPMRQPPWDIRYVMKEDSLFDAATLAEIWPTPRPYGESIAPPGMYDIHSHGGHQHGGMHHP